MPPKRPAVQTVGELHAYPHRPPLTGSRDWYWRVVLHRDGKQVTVKGASRRMPTRDVSAHLARLLVDGAAESGASGPGDVHTVADLLTAFCADADQRPGGNRRTYRMHLGRAKRLNPMHPVDACNPAHLRRSVHAGSVPGRRWALGFVHSGVYSGRVSGCGSNRAGVG